MSLPRSSFYRAASGTARKAADAALLATIEAIATEYPAYGYRRITHELRRRGTPVNPKRGARLMRRGQVAPTRVRRFFATTDSGHENPVFPDLTRDLRLTGPNQLWYADLTYIRLKTRFVFLAVLLDAWSRRVVGYAISHLLDARLPLAALEAALAQRRPTPGLIHPYDNATIESFMKTLKYEEIYAREYTTVDDVIRHLPHFLEELYNRRRLHSSLGYCPPEEYERQLLPAGLAACSGDHAQGRRGYARASLRSGPW
jgi:putative transposase